MRTRGFEDLVLGPFKELHPNITVNWQSMAYRALMEKQVVELAAGSSPDILGPEPTRYPQYRDAGYIADLTPFVQRDAAALADVVGIDWLQDPEGKSWTFPYGVLATIQIYNTALLDKFGINEPPKSWNPSDGGELLETAREITQRSSADQNPIWGFYSRNDSTTEVPTMLIQNGTNFVSDDYSRFRLHEPEFIDVIQFLYDLEFKYRVKPTRDDVAALNDTIRRNNDVIHRSCTSAPRFSTRGSTQNLAGTCRASRNCRSKPGASRPTACRARTRTR